MPRLEILVWECSFCEFSLVVDVKMADLPVMGQVFEAFIDGHLITHDRSIAEGIESLLK